MGIKQIIVCDGCDKNLIGARIDTISILEPVNF